MAGQLPDAASATQLCCQVCDPMPPGVHLCSRVHCHWAFTAAVPVRSIMLRHDGAY